VSTGEAGLSCGVTCLQHSITHGIETNDPVVGEIQRLADHPWRVRPLLEEVVRRLPSSEGSRRRRPQVALPDKAGGQAD
jgi:hypothetical protein